METSQVRLVSALDKVFPDREPPRWEGELSGLVGQRGSFQLAARFSRAQSVRKPLQVRIKTDAQELDAYQVELVPVSIPAFGVDDDGYLAHYPSLLPDRLEPLPPSAGGPQWEFTFERRHIGWQSLWFDLTLPASEVKIEIYEDEQKIESFDLPVRTIEASLPPAQIVNTRWFHADSLANVLDVEMWSEQHWKAIEAHLASAARMGVNSILTPLWPLPLDTAVGSYRPATQLLDIEEREPGVYHFATERADRWIDLMVENGITIVEVPHLFTQWGAKACPAFWIKKDGKVQRCFGWDTPASDPTYKQFLRQLIPFLRQYLENKVGSRNAWFHISDEPAAAQLDSYQVARDIAMPLLEGCQVIDALSSPAYSELVQTPVVAVDAVDGFRAKGIEPDWVYYCVSQNRNVANQFIAQRGARHRLIGLQLYKNQASGFLHWAFNFYYSQYSKKLIDPYRDTAAGGGFISGDAFIVYTTAEGGVEESIRHRMVGAGFDDLATCQFAQTLIGREQVLEIIDPKGDLDYGNGWMSEGELLERIQKLHLAIEQALAEGRPG
ncbi:MAG: DUF4091 domain-containing protein [Actinomycetaceae bacterium]|nr:DUF4091 domain-containing protein [Actinomycetaceae bacterium]